MARAASEFVSAADAFRHVAKLLGHEKAQGALLNELINGVVVAIADQVVELDGTCPPEPEYNVQLTPDHWFSVTLPGGSIELARGVAFFPVAPHRVATRDRATGIRYLRASFESVFGEPSDGEPPAAGANKGRPLQQGAYEVIARIALNWSERSARECSDATIDQLSADLELEFKRRGLPARSRDTLVTLARAVRRVLRGEDR